MSWSVTARFKALNQRHRQVQGKLERERAALEVPGARPSRPQQWGREGKRRSVRTRDVVGSRCGQDGRAPGEAVRESQRDSIN